MTRDIDKTIEFMSSFFIEKIMPLRNAYVDEHLFARLDSSKEELKRELEKRELFYSKELEEMGLVLTIDVDCNQLLFGFEKEIEDEELKKIRTQISKGITSNISKEIQRLKIEQTNRISSK